MGFFSASSYSAVFLLLCLQFASTAASPITLRNEQGEPFKVQIYLTLSKAPTIIALHGCGGMLNPQGAPNLRTQAYAKLLNAQGWHVVFTDSLSPRGVKSVCGGKNDVTQTQRLQDTRAAVAYVAQQPWADIQRIAILGWSHGGTAGLLASNRSVVYAAPIKATAVFYPGCTNAAYFGARSGWKPAMPVLMQLGADDDWTDPVPCQALAAAHGIVPITYANAHHGFDSSEPVAQSKTVVSRKTGAGVHSGGEPSARLASQTKLIEFFITAFE